MENISKFCTCDNLKCPMHPTNHDKGCSPCMEKNLRNGVIPDCFFNLIGGHEEGTGFKIKDFAETVMKREA